MGLGLGPRGPVAGGIFSPFQSIGWVRAGGVLSTAQSIAMGGSVTTAAVIAGLTPVLGIAAGVVIAGAVIRR